MDSMDIYSEEGTKVKFVNHGGHDKEPENAVKAGLIPNGIYTVEKTDVQGWSTGVTLKEFPGKEFNSVMFEEV